MIASAIFVALALGGLGVACRPQYGIAPRTFFALALGFGVATFFLPNAAAAYAAAGFALALGGITLSVDAGRNRLGL